MDAYYVPPTPVQSLQEDTACRACRKMQRVLLADSTGPYMTVEEVRTFRSSGRQTVVAKPGLIGCTGGRTMHIQSSPSRSDGHYRLSSIDVTSNL